MYKSIDHALISAFVERWQPETNSFHMPFGEMTITLHDVWYILQIPVTGKPVISSRTTEGLMTDMGLLLELPLDDKLGRELGWKHGRCGFDVLEKRLKQGNLNNNSVFSTYLLWLLGTTLFVDKTTTLVHAGFLEFLHESDGVQNYAWGAATLANLYRQLGEASRAGCTNIAGCLTLLQVSVSVSAFYLMLSL